jgi:hypothetical protein
VMDRAAPFGVGVRGNVTAVQLWSRIMSLFLMGFIVNPGRI